MSTMSRAHIEITHQIHRLGQLIDDIGPNGVDEIDRTELRSLLYGLYAILKLHTAQEDENYLSLGDDATQDGLSSSILRRPIEKPPPVDKRQKTNGCQQHNLESDRPG
jgi:hypothetical protein